METSSIESKNELASALVISPEQLLKHWQGHRGVTRKTIEAFPEDKLYNYSIGGMRPFATLVMEMLGMAVPGVKGVITGEWENPGSSFSSSRTSDQKRITRAVGRNNGEAQRTMATNSAAPLSGS